MALGKRRNAGVSPLRDVMKPRRSGRDDVLIGHIGEDGDQRSDWEGPAGQAAGGGRPCGVAGAGAGDDTRWSRVGE